MVLNNWQDVTEARAAADAAATKAGEILNNAEANEEDALPAVHALVEGLRLEIRVLGITISHAVDTWLYETSQRGR